MKLTKGELRALRKAEAARGVAWSVERGEDGQLEQVRPLSAKAEYRREVALERWARRSYDER